jgi:hypothetical protein
MTEQKNGNTKIWAIAVPCIGFALSLGLLIGQNIPRTPYITEGAQTQILNIQRDVTTSNARYESILNSLSNLNGQIVELKTKFDVHVTGKP